MRKQQTFWPGMMRVELLLFLFLAYPTKVSPHSLPEVEDRVSIPAVAAAPLDPGPVPSRYVISNTELPLLEPYTPAAVAAENNVEFLGHIGGVTDAVFVEGNYAYIGEGPRLIILDISNPAAPTVVSKMEPLFGVIQDIYVSGGYAYVASKGGGLRVVDVSTPVIPVEVGFYDTPGYAFDVVVAGTYAYVADYDGDLRVVDVSMPSTPMEVGFYAMPGYARSVAVAGIYAYVTDWPDGGLRIVDVSTPSTPMEMGFYDTPGQALDVEIVGTYAYVTDGGYGLRVVDVSTPNAPTEVGFYDTPDSACGVAVVGAYAYVADGHGGLRVVDVSIPSAPVEVGYYAVSGLAMDVAVTETYAYVAGDYRGLRVVDVSTPTAMVEIGFYDVLGSSYDVAMVGDYAYVGNDIDGLGIVDVSMPATPLEVGSYDMFWRVWNVTIAGNYAYIADGNNKLWVVDASTPTMPVEVGSCDISAAVLDVEVVGAYAYIAGGNNGLRVVDVSISAVPVEVGFHDTPGYALGVAVVGTYAYVADHDGGLRVMDISTPTAPVEVGYYDTSGWTKDVAVVGNYAYLADGNAGLRVVDVSMPSIPVEVGFCDTSGDAQKVVVVGEYAYVADFDDGLRVLDVSTLAAPVEVGFYDTPGLAQGVAVVGTYAYVADYDGGFFILRYTGPSTSTLNPIANIDGDSVYIVDWSDATGAMTYTLQEDDNAGFTSPVTRYNGSDSEYAVSSQVGGTWYYRVRAANTAGESDWSNIESVGVKPTSPVLDPIVPGDETYTVAWSDVTGATSYTLQEDDNTSFTSPTTRYTGGSTEYMISGQPEGVWYYRVRASNVAGDSDWSNIQSAVVLNVVGELTSASPYVSAGQSSYFLAELRAAGEPASGLDSVHLRVADRDISLHDDGSQGDFATTDSLYGTSVPFTQTGTFQVTLLYGSRELDSVAVTVIDNPALVVLTDWLALYAEFRDTGMAMYEDENGNQRHDLIELVERLHSYNYQQRGVVSDLPEEAPDYAALDYGQDTETRVQMGHGIDQVIATVNAQANNRVQNIVLLGDDQVVPFYRVYDPTDFYNEFNQNYPLDYQSREIAYPATIGGTQENATLLDSQAGYIMSDVPYGIRSHQVITRGTWLLMYPDLPRWATYPEPEMGVGRIFAPRPGQLSAALSRYQEPLFMTSGSAEAALFRAVNESGDVGTGVDFTALAERSLFPALRDWFGASLDDYDQVAQPWDAVDFAAALGQHNLVSWWGHTTHQSLQAGPGTVIDWHVFPQIVVSDPVAFVGLGCHLGYSVGRHPDGGGPVYPYDWGVVNALIAQGVTLYAPSSQAYTWPTAFQSPNLHELVIAQFTNHLMDYTAPTVGAVWQMGFRPYHITDPAVVENNNPATRVFHIAAAYGNVLYGLPTQPIEREQQTPPQVSYHAAPSLSARVAVNTIILPSITVEVPHFQTEQLDDGTTLFSVPNGGTHLAPTNGPALPLVIRTLTLPANVTVQNVRLVDVESQVYDRPVTLARPQFTTSNGGAITGTYELPAIYPENRYQYRIAQTSEGQQLILGAIPMLYDTARNRVTLQTRMQFVVDYQTTSPATGPQIVSMTVNSGLPVAINTLNQQIVADIYHDQEMDAWVAWSVQGSGAFVIASGISPVMVLADKTTRVTIPLDTTGWRPGPKDLAVYLLYEGAISDSENIPLMAEGLGLDDLDPVHHVYTAEIPVAVWQIAVRDETGALIADLEDTLQVSVDGQSAAAEVQAGELGTYNVYLPLDGVASGNHLVRISVADTRGLTGWREWSLTKVLPASVQIYLPLVLKGN